MTTHEFAYYRLAMETKAAVIPALMDALVAAREGAQRELRHLRALTTTSERQLRRYENQEHFPPGADIDDLVAVYAEATETSVFDLWEDAIRRAKSETREKRPPKKTLSRGVDAAATAAKNELKGSRQPKPKQRSKN